MAEKIRIQTNAASPALGTYSQAIRTGDLVFVTGQTGRDIGLAFWKWVWKPK